MCGHNFPFEACDAAHIATSLESREELGREYAIANDNCPAVQPDADPVEPDSDPADDTSGDAEDSGSATHGEVLFIAMVSAFGIMGALA
jgi:hypothetical protein